MPGWSTLTSSRLLGKNSSHWTIFPGPKYLFLTTASFCQQLVPIGNYTLCFCKHGHQWTEQESLLLPEWDCISSLVVPTWWFLCLKCSSIPKLHRATHGPSSQKDLLGSPVWPDQYRPLPSLPALLSSTALNNSWTVPTCLLPILPMSFHINENIFILCAPSTP